MQTYDKADASGERQGLQANLYRTSIHYPWSRTKEKRLALKPAIQRSTILAAVVALATGGVILYSPYISGLLSQVPHSLP